MFICGVLPMIEPSTETRLHGRVLTRSVPVAPLAVAAGLGLLTLPSSEGLLFRDELLLDDDRRVLQ
jgi:hypothetical protein